MHVALNHHTAPPSYLHLLQMPSFSQRPRQPGRSSTPTCTKPATRTRVTSLIQAAMQDSRTAAVHRPWWRYRLLIKHPNPNLRNYEGNHAVDPHLPAPQMHVLANAILGAGIHVHTEDIFTQVYSQGTMRTASSCTSVTPTRSAMWRLLRPNSWGKNDFPSFGLATFSANCTRSGRDGKQPSSLVSTQAMSPTAEQILTPNRCGGVLDIQHLCRHHGAVWFHQLPTSSGWSGLTVNLQARSRPSAIPSACVPRANGGIRAGVKGLTEVRINSKHQQANQQAKLYELT